MLHAALRFPIFSTLIALLASFTFADQQDVGQTQEHSGEKPAADSSGAYFAGLMDACQQIDFLSRNERFESLLKATERFRNYLKKASDHLPPSAHSSNSLRRFTIFSGATMNAGFEKHRKNCSC
ncbi:MAG TPA: hypothetical protein DIV79_03365 [Opitutae bacterium]|nr:hypothetical protein [Opitutaceae bacterium]HCR29038.1 hypothetical protein [Opitutae bacterium]|tara:strand:+ start:648 stop:1019 length:372 start_codon:yes stop_codon:yes gene_type:complete